MYNDNVITRVTQVTEEGEFKNLNGFYVFLKAKSKDLGCTYMLSGMCYKNDTDVPIPCTLDSWNPVCLKSMTLTAPDLAAVDVYVGEEYPLSSAN